MYRRRVVRLVAIAIAVATIGLLFGISLPNDVGGLHIPGDTWQRAGFVQTVLTAIGVLIAIVAVFFTIGPEPSLVFRLGGQGAAGRVYHHVVIRCGVQNVNAIRIEARFEPAVLASTFGAYTSDGWIPVLSIGPGGEWLSGWDFASERLYAGQSIPQLVYVLSLIHI